MTRTFQLEENGFLQELMKVAGIPEWLLWFGWITYSLMIYPIIITAVTLILTTQLMTQPFYANVSALLVWIILMLYCVAILTFLFAVGILFGTKRKYTQIYAIVTPSLTLSNTSSCLKIYEQFLDWMAVSVGVITWFLTSSRWIVSIVGDMEDEKNQLIAIPLLFLLPNLVLFNAFRTLEYFEFKGDSIVLPNPLEAVQWQISVALRPRANETG